MSASSRDRTLEFRNTVQSLRGRQMNGAVSRAAVPGGFKQNSEFINIAKAISGDITNTYTKLEKLTLLAKYDFFFSTLSHEMFSFKDFFLLHGPFFVAESSAVSLDCMVFYF